MILFHEKENNYMKITSRLTEKKSQESNEKVEKIETNGFIRVLLKIR